MAPVRSDDLYYGLWHVCLYNRFNIMVGEYALDRRDTVVLTCGKRGGDEGNKVVQYNSSRYIIILPFCAESVCNEQLIQEIED